MPVLNLTDFKMVVIKPLRTRSLGNFVAIKDTQTGNNGRAMILDGIIGL